MKFGWIDNLLGRCPQGVPIAIWREALPLRIFLRVTSALVLVILGVHTIVGLDVFGVAELPYGLQALHKRWLFPLGVLLILSMAIAQRIWLRLAIARIRRAGYSVCHNCGYSLSGLPDVHACPECGTLYSLDETRVLWKTAIES